LAILIAEQMTANDTNRLRASWRQWRRRTRSLQAAHCRAQFCATALATLLSLAAVTSTRAQASPSVEYQVKAAFLLNFAKFIEWPPNVFQGEKSPITVCIFRYDPFGSALDDIIRGKNINNRELLARRINELPDLKACQLLFVSNTEDKHLSEILNSLKGASALVVGESEDFAERGGGVQFFLENNKLRFAVNVDAVQRAHLAVSSKVLALARIVHDQGHPKGN
jgi:hypothetical protein